MSGNDLATEKTDQPTPEVAAEAAADAAAHDPARFSAPPAEGEGVEVDMDAVVTALKTVFDPEIPVDIYELGLIYDVAIKDGKADVKMTLTAPGCPVAGEMPGNVAAALRTVPGIVDADVELVWEPPWEPSRMSEAARLELGWM